MCIRKTMGTPQPPQLPPLFMKNSAPGAPGETLRIAFFDNDETNIAPCQKGKPYNIQLDEKTVAVQVYCVDVKECERTGLPERRGETLLDCHTRLVDKLQNEEFEPDENVRKVAEALACIGSKSFFDDSSGVKPDALVKDYLDFDLWVFDWDKTISQCSGLIAAERVHDPRMGPDRVPETRFDQGLVDAAWEGHADAIYEQLRARLPEGWDENDADDLLQLYTKNPDVVLKAMCGGTHRVEALRRAFAQKRGRDPTDIFVLTANPARAVISKLATTLFPAIRDDQVFSPAQYPARAHAPVFGEEKYLRGMSKYELINFQVMHTLKEKRKYQKASRAAQRGRGPRRRGGRGGRGAQRQRRLRQHSRESGGGRLCAIRHRRHPGLGPAVNGA